MGADRGPFPMLAVIEGKLPSAFASTAMSSAEGKETGPKGPERAVKNVHVFVAGSAGFVRDEFMPPPDRSGRRRNNFV